SKLNFFSAWVESREKGVSVLNDTRRANGSEVPLPVTDRDPTKPYLLETLIDKVGLPTPKLDKPGPGVTMATYLARWQAQFGNRIEPGRGTQPGFDMWIALPDHVPGDEA